MVVHRNPWEGAIYLLLPARAMKSGQDFAAAFIADREGWGSGR